MWGRWKLGAGSDYLRNMELARLWEWKRKVGKGRMESRTPQWASFLAFRPEGAKKGRESIAEGKKKLVQGVKDKRYRKQIKVFDWNAKGGIGGRQLGGIFGSWPTVKSQPYYCQEGAGR